MISQNVSFNFSEIPHEALKKIDSHLSFKDIGNIKLTCKSNNELFPVFKKNAIFRTIPPEMVGEIFSHLSLKDIIGIKLTCKSYNKLISALAKSPTFAVALTQYNHLLFDVVDSDEVTTQSFFLYNLAKSDIIKYFEDNPLEFSLKNKDFPWCIDDEDISLVMVKKNGEYLRHTGFSIKKNKTVVLAAVKQNGMALLYADRSLKQDVEVVLAAAKQNRGALGFVNSSIKEEVLAQLD